MLKEQLIKLYGYNYWANQRILEAAAQLTDELFSAPTADSWGSLRGTLVHTLTAEWLWRERLGGISPTFMLNEEDFPTVAALAARWQQEEEIMWAYLDDLSEPDLERSFQYKTTDGQQWENEVSEILMHIVLHGMQHRAEAAAALTAYGHSPGDLDLVVYLRESSLTE